METKSYNEIYNNIKNYVIAHQNKITDFTDGSVIMAFCESVSRVIENLYLNAKLGFSAYMRGLPYSVFNFKVLEGTKAGGRVVFTLGDPQPYITVIPEGTSLSGAGVSFHTTERGLIMAGATESAPVPASADAIGDSGNVDAGAISVINGRVPSAVDSVTNPEPFTGGINKEKWNDFVARFSEYITGLQNTNSNGVKTLITQSALARSVGVVEHFPPLNGVYNATIFCEDGSGGISPSALEEIKMIIEGDGTVLHPSRKAVGLNYRYSAPDITTLDFTIIVDLNRERMTNVSVDDLLADLKSAAKNHIDGMTIGKNYYAASLIALMKGNKYINNVRITTPSLDIIEIGMNGIFRSGSVSINYTMS